MRIILDIDFLSKEHPSESTRFITRIINEMARRYAGDSFIFLAFQRNKPLSDLSPNVSIHYINKGPLYRLSRKWWYRNSLPGMLKKLQPSLFVGTDNVYINNRGLPTCLFIVELNHMLEQAKESGSTHKLLSSALRKATSLITFSEHSRQLIQRLSFISLEKIQLLGLDWKPPSDSMSWTEKESIKVQYAAGCEYFVFAGEIDKKHNLLGLLKAFSQFKKWQQSNMQLVLVGNVTPWTAELKEKLSTFKYRADVHVIPNPSPKVLNEVISAAYALVYPAEFDYFPVNILHAMKAGVAVIASRLPVIEEMAGSGVIYPIINSKDGFGKSMQEIYKDEDLRSRVIENASKWLLASVARDVVEDCHDFFEGAYTSKSY